MLKNNIKQKYITLFPLAVFVSLIIAEVLARFFIIFAKVGVIFWYLMLFILILYVSTGLIFIVKHSITNKSYFSLLFLAFFLIIVLIYAGNPNNISFETTQQDGCALSAFSEREDWGFMSYCFLGYPARQFYLSIIPSAVLGRSLFALNIGGALYLILGIIAFIAGVKKYYKNNLKVNDFLLGALLFIPFHFYYFNFLLLNFEQSLYPIALVFFTIGVFLDYIALRSLYKLIILGFLLLISVNMYTPGIALAGLIILWLIIDSLKEKNKAQKYLYLLIIFGGVLSFLIGLQYRTDIKLLNSTVPLKEYLYELLKGAQLIFTPESFRQLISPYFLPVTILLVFLGLSLEFGLNGFVITMWIVAVFVFSILSQGYANPEIRYRLQRFTMVAPFLMYMLFDYLARKNLKFSRLLIITAVAVVISGIYYHYNYVSTKELSIDNKTKVQTLQNISRSLPASSEPKLLYLAKVDIHTSSVIGNGAGYFFPGTQVVSTDEYCFEADAKFQNNTFVLTALKNAPEMCKNIDSTFVAEINSNLFLHKYTY